MRATLTRKMSSVSDSGGARQRRVTWEKQPLLLSRDEDVEVSRGETLPHVFHCVGGGRLTSAVTYRSLDSAR